MFFLPAGWFLVPVAGLRKEVGHGQEANALRQSGQLPAGFAVSTLSAAVRNLGVPASLVLNNST